MPLKRDRDGKCSAADQFDFQGARKLDIETYKYDGRLVTRAAVNLHTENGFSHAFGLGSGGDFSKRLIVTTARGTEKNILVQHAQAGALVPALLEEAKAHYEKYPPGGVF